LINDFIQNAEKEMVAIENDQTVVGREIFTKLKAINTSFPDVKIEQVIWRVILSFEIELVFSTACILSHY
jgi:hypothetical protein